MKKKSLILLVLGTIGGLMFSIGMVLGLLAEYSTTAGIILGAIGVLILLSMLPIFYKGRAKKARKEVKKELVVAYTVGTLSSLVLGTGMSLIMTGEKSIILGMAIGVIGLVGCIFNYPLYLSVKNK